MKNWVESLLPIMGAVFLFPWTGHSAALRVLQDEVPFSVTYEYRIDLNISEATPSIETALDLLRNDTLITLENLVYNKDDPPFRIVDIETIMQGMFTRVKSARAVVHFILISFLPRPTGSCESESDLCSYVQSTIMLMVGDSIDDLIIEYATLGEVQSFFRSFNRDHENIFVSFMGPSVVRTNIDILLENVNGRMSEVEIAIFEETFLSIVGPPLLLDEPAINVRSATVFLQRVTEHTRRRLQTGGSNIVGVYVTGQCNSGCTSSQFEVGDAIDVGAGNFRRMLQSNGQAAGTDYFDDVTTSVALKEEVPDISDDYLDIFIPPNYPFPYWILVVLGLSVFIIITSVCCAACRSRKERTQAKNQHIGRSLTAEKSQDSTTDSQDTDQPGTRASKANNDREIEMMPHLRKAVHERSAGEGRQEAASAYNQHHGVGVVTV
jgi:hypothetical protein